MKEWWKKDEENVNETDALSYGKRYEKVTKTDSVKQSAEDMVKCKRRPRIFWDLAAGTGMKRDDILLKTASRTGDFEVFVSQDFQDPWWQTIR